MKKLILLVCLFVGVGLSANVMAQSTGTNPQPGAKHHYRVNGGANGNSNYEWKIFKNVSDLLTDVTGTDATVSVHSPATSITEAQVDITWATGLAAGTKYFVQVKETDKTTSCSTNSKAFVVTISANTFNLAISVNGTSCYDAAVVVSSVSGEPTYTHGTATLVYTVTPAGLVAGQKYSFTVTPPVITGCGVGAVAVSNGTNPSGNLIQSTDEKPLTLTYVITKSNPTNNASAVDAQKFTSTVAIATGTGLSSVGVKSLETTGTQSASTVVDRPNTSLIQAVN